MAEHSDLISEMPFLEKLNTEERLKLARKRRNQQLKKWSQREKEYTLINKRKRSDVIDPCNKKNGYKIHFVPSVMLLEAATRNDIEEVKRLLMLGVSPDSTNEDGLTALHQCCIDNCEEMMRLLIEFGANVNAKDSEQWTPLHAAATCGHLHLIKLLIEKEADLLAVNADGNMPYDICEDEQTLDYIEAEMAKRGITQELIDQIRIKTEQQMLFDMKELIKNGYDINYKDGQGATPLHVASANGYLSVIEFLVDNNASVDEIDNDLWQPIHAAACWGHIDVVEFLVQNGADLEAKTKNDETPFDICEDPDLKNRILQLKSEIDAKKAVSSNRLRRSHSTNTRTHSIRRTSIREKSQIAKREAIEEARMWHEKAIESIESNKKEDSDNIDSGAQLYHDFNKKLLTDSSPVDLNSIKVRLETCSTAGDYHFSDTVSNQQSVASKANLDHQIASSIHKNNNSYGDCNRLDQIENDHSYYDDSNQNPNGNTADKNHNHNNLNMLETSRSMEVNAINLDAYHHDFGLYNNNASGTLIDLKKQRSEKHRNCLNNIHSDRIKTFVDHSNNPTNISINHMVDYDHHSNMNPTPSSANSGAPANITNSKPSSAVLAFDSPNTVRKKFRGTPSELIGEDEKRGCCTIC